MFKEHDLNHKLVYFSLEWDEMISQWYMESMNKDYEFINNTFSSTTLDKNVAIKEARKYIKTTSLIK